MATEIGDRAVRHGDLQGRLNETLRAEGIEILAAVPERFAPILTPDALRFVAKLQRTYGSAREAALSRRREVQARIDAGSLPTFLKESTELKVANWKVAPVPRDLQDRRVEITAPVDRKMVIQALNSGASVYMADFEDAHAPTWAGTLDGQLNLRDAVSRTITFRSPEGKDYRLAEKTAVLLVRPRGWHLTEKHLRIDGKIASASIFDFALYFFHNARALLAAGTGPYFYLPKMESHREARIWNEVFVSAQAALDLPRGTIKATVLIETILASFEMDEILYELRDHCVGLNCGRWDYIFSYIKKFGRHREAKPSFLLPDRALVTMESHFLKSYCQLLIETCHRRGAHAMGGMAAQIPIKDDPEANAAALAKVRADKLREVRLGHDGTWVAHPGLVPIAREPFDEFMPGANQVGTTRPRVEVRETDLLQAPSGTISEAGLRTNIRVALLYMTSWLQGRGCVPINHLMEDAATAEISRAQIWQWIRHPQGVLADGRKITLPLCEGMQREILGELRSKDDSGGKLELAGRLLGELTSRDEFAEFITLGAYEYLD